MAEYGDPDVPEEAAFLKGISPYHNLRAETLYPEPLIVTSTRAAAAKGGLSPGSPNPRMPPK